MWIIFSVWEAIEKPTKGIGVWIIGFNKEKKTLERLPLLTVTMSSECSRTTFVKDIVKMVQLKENAVSIYRDFIHKYGMYSCICKEN